VSNKKECSDHDSVFDPHSSLPWLHAGRQRRVWGQIKITLLITTTSCIHTAPFLGSLQVGGGEFGVK